MQPAMRIPLRLAPRIANGTTPLTIRSIHASAVKAANVAPVVGTGPPPEAPAPVQRPTPNERVERRRKQAEMLKTAKAIRSAKDGKGSSLSPMKRRFWKDVSVAEVDGALQVFLDARPLRHPNTKEIVRVPLSKPTLATALAIEWDLLTSAQQATRQHLIPLTSLVCRATDIAAEDDAAGGGTIRAAIADSVLRYLDTDSLLCWAPPAGAQDLRNEAGESLRDVQKRVAEDTVGFLATHVWPGVAIKPVLDGHSIFPASQDEGVREVVRGWVVGLSAWEIAGLERAVLAGKSLVAAARVVAEWSEGPAGLPATREGARFGAEEAARATSLEVDWQTGHWGEVEDTHDVGKEDVRRQLGSVVLLVSGTGKSS
ncbi:mitochondrial molecular chaperone [Cordyceps fumosorosea ARSEF 2679]|uniref:Mitochondrial molecular chaperone n=1 Tax=Cordyceps fumosorosea (strain ARSEF 2679) TaxID=1081104 RepID=A0A167SWF2_CORFA|nr:mitochondrial molecular chaperone [Cordyceps fumosorosea ARSEF 2679]OAA59998.1 mitochondrial molecular chaperone [Cordyceps fumosorosea ARSEF 2679]